MLHFTWRNSLIHLLEKHCLTWRRLIDSFRGDSLTATCWRLTDSPGGDLMVHVQELIQSPAGDSLFLQVIHQLEIH